MKKMKMTQILKGLTRDGRIRLYMLTGILFYTLILTNGFILALRIPIDLMLFGVYVYTTNYVIHDKKNLISKNKKEVTHKYGKRR